MRERKCEERERKKETETERETERGEGERERDSRARDLVFPGVALLLRETSVGGERRVR